MSVNMLVSETCNDLSSESVTFANYLVADICAPDLDRMGKHSQAIGAPAHA